MANAVQLTLSNSARVQITGASAFAYDIGANATAGDTAASPGATYAQFAAALGVATLPTGATQAAGTANYIIPAGTTATGTVIDGYVAGATVFADANGNGIWDAGEATTTTDARGNFSLPGARGALISAAGTDLSTGRPSRVCSQLRKAPPW
jgi:hypothetical protein